MKSHLSLGSTKILAAWLVFAITYFALLFVGSKYSLSILPNTGDESSVLFQAKIFSIPSLTAAPPPLAPLFASHYLAITPEHWFSEYPPVYSAMLASGIFLGSPMAMAWVYSVLTLTGLALLLRSWGFSNRTAFGFGVLLSLSPTFFFHSMSYYTHLGELFFWVLALMLLFEYFKGENTRLLWVVSVLMGLSLGVRPLTTVLLYAPFVGVVIYQGLRRRTLQPMIAVLTPMTGILVMLLLYNAHLTGDFRNIAYLQAGGNDAKLAWSNLDLPGLGRIWEMWRETSKWSLALGYFPGFDVKFSQGKEWDASFLFAVLSLAGFAGYIRTVTTQFKRNFAVLLFVAYFSLILGHVFYAFSGGRYGERFFFELSWLPVLVIFTFLATRKNRLFHALIVLWCIQMAVVDLGTLRGFRENNLRRMDPFLRAAELTGEDSVIFMKTTPDFDCTFYTQNDPRLRGRVYVCDPSLFQEGADPAQAELFRATLMEKLGRSSGWIYTFDSALGRSTLLRTSPRS